MAPHEGIAVGLDLRGTFAQIDKMPPHGSHLGFEREGAPVTGENEIDLAAPVGECDGAIGLELMTERVFKLRAA